MEHSVTQVVDCSVERTHLVTNHVDGPYILLPNGSIRWLTIPERIGLFLFNILPKELR